MTDRFIRTVTGDIEPDLLGVTQPHEHTIILPGPSCRVNASLLLDSPEASTAELSEYKAAGGAALVDAQPIGVERSPRLMRQVSEQSGVRIVAATGFHRDCFYPEGHFFRTENAETLAERLVREIESGMTDDLHGEETDIKAGVVKFTSEYHVIPPLARKACEAAALAHHRTGIPILTHTERGTCGLEQVELARSFGVDPSAMILCHLDRNPDRFLHREIAATGAYLVYDGIARTKYWPDSVIIDLILDMLQAGHGNRIMLAMDVATRSTWRHYGGGPGLDYLLRRFVPRLRAAGVTSDDLDRMLVGNPARALTFRTSSSGHIPDRRFVV